MSFNNKSLSNHEDFVARYKESLSAWHEKHKIEVLLLAERHARLNHPGLTDISFEPLISPIRAAYDAKKHEASLKFKVKSAKAKIEINGAASKKHEELINESLADLETKHRNADLDVIRFTSDVNLKRYRKYRLILWLLSAGECVWMALVFLGIGTNYLQSAIIGLSIGACQVFLVQKVVHTLKQTQDYAKLIFRTRVAIACAIIWSSIVGIIRCFATQNGMAIGGLLLALLPFVFAAVNLIFIATTSFITLHHIPTESELNRALKHEEMCNKRDNLANAIQQQNGSKASLVTNHAELMSSGADAQNDEIEIHGFIEDLFLEARGWYVTENIMRREDRKVPQSFYQSTRLIS